MAHALFFLCPNCTAEDISPPRCHRCDATLAFQEQSLVCNQQRYSVPQYYQLLVERLSLRQDAAVLDRRRAQLSDHLPPAPLRISAAAELSQGQRLLQFIGYHRLFRRKIDLPVKKTAGRLVFRDGEVQFVAGKELWRWPVADFTCVTTTGHHFQFKVRGEPFYQLHFREESALKYEILFRQWLNRYYAERHQTAVVEYQPHLRLKAPNPSRKYWQLAFRRKRLRVSGLEKWLLKGVVLMVRGFLGLYIRVAIAGAEYWHPQQRGFVLVNHQSALDPFIIGAYFDHRIAFVTKSDSFGHFFSRWFLKWTRGLPTTRYQTDPAMVRAVRSVLENGLKVGVFPEGERSWDGQLLPFKRSLVKILMASREAIYPIVIKNSFQFWPRWAALPRRAAVQLAIAAPFCLLPNLHSLEEQRHFLEAIFRDSLEEHDGGDG